MAEQKREVADFFNAIADNYKSKYSGKDVFHAYFFNERLEEATRTFSFRGKSILDIGAGTGDLYDRLVSLEKTVDYSASDVAVNMLEHSTIPAQRRFVGAAYNIVFPQPHFDFVYMLGVTTYLDDDELRKNLAFIHRALSRNGTAVVTFTNRTSFDWRFRRFFKMILRPFGIEARVLTQAFTIHPKSLSEARTLVAEQFDVTEVRWLNHTVFPFSNVLKNVSVGMARSIHRSLKSPSALNLLSSDFMLVLKKKVISGGA